jgi:hypothetical protein
MSQQKNLDQFYTLDLNAFSGERKTWICRCSTSNVEETQQCTICSTPKNHLWQCDKCLTVNHVCDPECYTCQPELRNMRLTTIQHEHEHEHEYQQQYGEEKSRKPMKSTLSNNFSSLHWQCRCPDDNIKLLIDESCDSCLVRRAEIWQCWCSAVNDIKDDNCYFCQSSHKTGWECELCHRMFPHRIRSCPDCVLSITNHPEKKHKSLPQSSQLAQSSGEKKPWICCCSVSNSEEVQQCILCSTPRDKLWQCDRCLNNNHYSAPGCFHCCPPEEMRHLNQPSEELRYLRLLKMQHEIQRVVAKRCDAL